MTEWLTVTNFLLALVVSLVAWIGKGFDKRLREFERVFSEKMEHQAVLLERGQRHESAIARLQEELAELRIEVARWEAH